MTRMIKVHIRMVGFLAALGGRQELSLDVRSGSNIVDVLRLLCENLNSAFTTLVFDAKGDVYKGIMFILDGDVVLHEDLRDRSIWENCELTIVPIVAGG